MSQELQALRLLVVMAHPDDCEFLVGGTLFHLKKLGWKLGIVTMTAGDCGSATFPREEIARMRYAEAQNAADYLGAWYACAGLMDVEVVHNVENLRRVVDVMRRFDPDVVITHSPVDYMLDHEEASRLARGAAFALAMPNYETRQNPPAKQARSTSALPCGVRAGRSTNAHAVVRKQKAGHPLRLKAWSGPCALAISSTVEIEAIALSKARKRRN
jgi:LmbE family N-acetylglucosaminyl deacetylase